MHTCDLIDLAALVATHGRAFIEGAGRLSSTSLEQYWTASKCRLDRWSRALKALSTNESVGRFSTAQAVIEEILLSEILTRVWSGVLSAHDKRRDGLDGEPIARSVYLGHLEARHRALALLVNRPAVGANTIDELNRLRRRAERWIDLLIGVVFDGDAVNDFAIDPDRAREFAADFRDRRNGANEQQAWQLTLASLRAAFLKSRERESPNAESNGQIAAAIVACFPPDLFDATGVLRSLWVVRLTNTTNDAQGMLDELVRMDVEPVGISSRPRRF
jgi:hypothetical protein